MWVLAMKLHPARAFIETRKREFSPIGSDPYTPAATVAASIDRRSSGRLSSVVGSEETAAEPPIPQLLLIYQVPSTPIRLPIAEISR